jgi:hypothetical protein
VKIENATRGTLVRRFKQGIKLQQITLRQSLLFCKPSVIFKEDLKMKLYGTIITLPQPAIIENTSNKGGNGMKLYGTLNPGSTTISID